MHAVGMVELSKINEFVQEVAEKFNPEKVVLFGSYADGSATEDSDVDLFVMMNYTGRSAEQALAIRRAIRRAFPLDLIVKTPREASQRVRQGDFFMQAILNRGRVVYERTR